MGYDHSLSRNVCASPTVISIQSNGAENPVDILLGRVLGASCWDACFSADSRSFLVPLTLIDRTNVRVLQTVNAYPFGRDREGVKAGKAGYLNEAQERWNSLIKRVTRARSVIALADEPIDFYHCFLHGLRDDLRKVAAESSWVHSLPDSVRFTAIGRRSYFSAMTAMKYPACEGLQDILETHFRNMIINQIVGLLGREDIDKAASGHYSNGSCNTSRTALRQVRMLIPVVGVANDRWSCYDGVALWLGEHLTSRDTLSKDGPIGAWLESSIVWAREKEAQCKGRNVGLAITEARASEEWTRVARF